jgi:ComF family protein
MPKPWLPALPLLTALPRQLLQRASRRLGGPCAVCRQWCGEGVCRDCLTLHLRPVARCRQCALGVPDIERCGACLADPPPIARSVVAFDYAFPWDRLIQQLKFDGRTELAAPLARLLSQALAADAAPSRVDLLLPVPLSAARLAERGYNQAGLVAQALAQHWSLPCPLDWLQRPLDTPHQADLPREERRRNLRGAFMVDPRRRAQLARRRVALVDDVMTTGATAREAAGELLRAGAAQVECWSLARTA